MGFLLKINLNIERLVLDGFDKKDTTNIGKIIESELARLLENKNIHEIKQLKNHDTDLITGELPISPAVKRNNTELLGTSIAKSIYSSLEGSTR